jgi:CheY-like chemotaxis protein
MMTRHILFVEDEDEQQDAFETAIGDWNAAHAGEGKEFAVKIASCVEEAYSDLDRLRFDAALFDLRVKRSTEEPGRAEPAGNSLAIQAMRLRGIPVAIMTADESALDAEVRSCGKVRIFDKNAVRNDVGNAYDNAVAWFGSLWGMMKVLDAARQKIDTSSADIFLRRLWPKWESFAELEAGDEELTGIVTRQYVNHIGELLGLDGPDTVSWHPFENYVHPSLLEDRAHTGDIFRFDDGLWVVMTPQCDMATRKVPNVILAECRPGVENWEENIVALRAADSKTKKKEPTKFLSALVNQNVGPACHFLPPLPGEAVPLLVHFSSVRAVPMKDVNERLAERVASVSSPFLANIVQRFGAYMSRMGQPNIDVERFL